MNKIAVYAICKNEINFIERCLKPILNADYIVITDTGSTDGTYEKLIELQKEIPQLSVFQHEVYPWRFDVARNIAMQYIPEDANILVSIDMDDVFPANWREIIEEDFDKGYNKIYGIYQYYFDNGKKGGNCLLDRVSKRNAHWEHPLHESLVCDGEPVNAIRDERFLVEHRQDNSKHRDYFEVIKNNLDMNDPYTLLCYGYELFNKQKPEEGLRYFDLIYGMNTEYTTRRWLVMCARWLREQGRKAEALEWYNRALGVNRPDSSYEDDILYNGSLEEEISAYQEENKDRYYKIAVYAICGNEAHNVDEWMNSMWEADYICVLDTGSTDGSYEKLLKYQQDYPSKVIISQKIYNPWRFDTPRNDSMELVPADADICICTDLDERLTATWADKVRKLWTPKCERGYYLYAWSHLGNGEPARVFWYDKIHANKGEWKWQYPVHEALMHPIYGDSHLAPDQVCRLPDDFIMLHHYPTFKAGRKNYLPLLEQRAKEYPNDFYGLIYLAHEYKYQSKYEECITFIYKNILPVILKEGDNMDCLPDLYMFLGDCYLELHKEQEAETNYKAGIVADPLYRDNYIKLSRLYYIQHKYEQALDVMNDCFKTSRRLYTWLETDAAWSSEPWDLLCLIYWELHAVHMSYLCAKMAFMENPTDERLKNNLDELTKAIQHH